MPFASSTLNVQASGIQIFKRQVSKFQLMIVDHDVMSKIGWILRRVDASGARDWKIEDHMMES
jgi:hypothetical protein